MAINMAEMEEDRRTPADLRRLEEGVNALIEQTEGAHSYHKIVTRVLLRGIQALDYFRDPADIYVIYLPPDSPKLSGTPSEVIEEARKIRNGNESIREDFVAFLERRVGITDGVATKAEMTRRITFLGDHFMDIYDSSRQVHVRVPSTRLPDTFMEIIRLYQHQGFGLVGYAPAGGFI